MSTTNPCPTPRADQRDHIPNDLTGLTRRRRSAPYRRGLALLALAAAGFLTLPLLPGPHPAAAHTVVLTSGGEMDPGTTSGARALASSGSASCISCHRFEAALSHPIDVRPSMATPAGLPLDAGRITCMTCHSESAARPEHTRRSGNSHLRTDDAINQCTQCHTPGRGSGPHTAVAGWAHLTPVSKHSERRAASLDAESSMCITCHDGTVATDIGTHNVTIRGVDMPTGHPIGVAYGRPKARHEEPIPLTPQRALDPRVRLFDQKVGCGSCHSVYSKTDHLLVMHNSKSKLCLSCHVQ